MAEREAREAEQLVLCRTRILNQVELAFLKSERSAAKYITCSGTRYSERCDAPAKVLCLTHENPGATVIEPEQIAGALCDEHLELGVPFKTTAGISCAYLEYDGIKQIYINRAAPGRESAR